MTHSSVELVWDDPQQCGVTHSSVEFVWGDPQQCGVSVGCLLNCESHNSVEDRKVKNEINAVVVIVVVKCTD